MGGEKVLLRLAKAPLWGSPPRRRGKAGAALRKERLSRITPAWAGKSPIRELLLIVSRDHPRVGGEKLGKISAPNIGQGSPPHRRGKEVKSSSGFDFPGITPAWAGKSRWCARGQTRARDHPRMGGEKCLPPFKVGCAQGSPPHGRGKVAAGLRSPRSLGITPAWAGKSLASQPWSPPLWMMVIRPRP